MTVTSPEDFPPEDADILIFKAIWRPEKLDLLGTFEDKGLVYDAREGSLQVVSYIT